MYCKLRNRECQHAGVIMMEGCSELGEPEGWYETPVCWVNGSGFWSSSKTVCRYDTGENSEDVGRVEQQDVYSAQRP